MTTFLPGFSASSPLLIGGGMLKPYSSGTGNVAAKLEALGCTVFRFDPHSFSFLKVFLAMGLG